MHLGSWVLAAATVTAPTGPPELLVRWHVPLERLDRAGYEQRLQHFALSADLVPVRDWPPELPPDAPVFLTPLAGPRVTLAIRGDASSGFVLLVDRDANGKLDDPEIPLRRTGDAWAATFPAQHGGGPVWVDARWEQLADPRAGEPMWTLLLCQRNVRRGSVELAGRKRAFAITGDSGIYGRGSLEVFFDLDGDGHLALDSPYSRERFTVAEERVVVGHTAYRFSVDPAGEALTLTQLPGRFEPRPNLDLGSKAPDFTLQDLDGQARSLSEFRGRVVLLDFWALGCAPCIWEMPALAALRAKYRDSGFEIVGVHVGPLVPQIAATCAAKGADWPLLVDGNNELAARYRVEGFPTPFLLDRKGRILQHFPRGAELEKAVEAALRR